MVDERAEILADLMVWSKKVGKPQDYGELEWKFRLVKKYCGNKKKPISMWAKDIERRAEWIGREEETSKIYSVLLHSDWVLNCPWKEPMVRLDINVLLRGILYVEQRFPLAAADDLFAWLIDDVLYEVVRDTWMMAARLLALFTKDNSAWLKIVEQRFCVPVEDIRGAISRANSKGLKDKSNLQTYRHLFAPSKQDKTAAPLNVGTHFYRHSLFLCLQIAIIHPERLPKIFGISDPENDILKLPIPISEDCWSAMLPALFDVGLMEGVAHPEIIHRVHQFFIKTIFTDQRFCQNAQLHSGLEGILNREGNDSVSNQYILNKLEKWLLVSIVDGDILYWDVVSSWVQRVFALRNRDRFQELRVESNPYVQRLFAIVDADSAAQYQIFLNSIPILFDQNNLLASSRSIRLQSFLDFWISTTFASWVGSSQGVWRFVKAQQLKEGLQAKELFYNNDGLARAAQIDLVLHLPKLLFHLHRERLQKGEGFTASLKELYRGQLLSSLFQYTNPKSPREIEVHSAIQTYFTGMSGKEYLSYSMPLATKVYDALAIGCTGKNKEINRMKYIWTLFGLHLNETIRESILKSISKEISTEYSWPTIIERRNMLERFRHYTINDSGIDGFIALEDFFDELFILYELLPELKTQAVFVKECKILRHKGKGIELIGLKNRYRTALESINVLEHLIVFHEEYITDQLLKLGNSTRDTSIGCQKILESYHQMATVNHSDEEAIIGAIEQIKYNSLSLIEDIQSKISWPESMILSETIWRLSCYQETSGRKIIVLTQQAKELLQHIEDRNIEKVFCLLEELCNSELQILSFVLIQKIQNKLIDLWFDLEEEKSLLVVGGQKLHQCYVQANPSRGLSSFELDPRLVEGKGRLLIRYIGNKEYEKIGEMLALDFNDQLLNVLPLSLAESIQRQFIDVWLELEGNNPIESKKRGQILHFGAGFYERYNPHSREKLDDFYSETVIRLVRSNNIVIYPQLEEVICIGNNWTEEVLSTVGKILGNDGRLLLLNKLFHTSKRKGLFIASRRLIGIPVATVFALVLLFDVGSDIFETVERLFQQPMLGNGILIGLTIGGHIIPTMYRSHIRGMNRWKALLCQIPGLLLLGICSVGGAMFWTIAHENDRWEAVFLIALITQIIYGYGVGDFNTKGND